ncbi:hypothetical protein D7Y13_20055 [Corallococcus praedator]|uniref:Uncharacterized protein n=3 Tax=Corallococcus TaxID=83461 RepID=A0A3A8IZ90_9BACT|nr:MULTISPECIES: hypothetical protein [Corallococcus]RYZ33746.1 MAG: hypothetical protein EOO71_41190 [Myxococcaceae bacterium]MBE4752193.1 hypothetical protein [Corallococcus soli]MCY1029973.1 hypothetical protein [Corallococcus sp. BB11-1]MCY1041077.1 hypothetical protein [Corallococcus sp. bb12-1]RKG88018.1 hypothetical protein D7V88_15060 [Corallococcus terminator]
MTLTEMLPLPLAVVEIGALGEQLAAAGGLVITAAAALWAAWTRPAQPAPVPVPVRRNPPRRR